MCSKWSFYALGSTTEKRFLFAYCCRHILSFGCLFFNPLNVELIPICYLLALLGVHFLYVSRIRVKSLTLRLLMSYIYIYIYGAPILDVSRSHTTTYHSRWDSSGRVISSSQRPLPDNTRHSQQTNIHAPGGIRIHDLCGRWPAEIVGSNPTGVVDICLFWVSCVVR